MFEKKHFWDSHRIMMTHEYYHIENLMNLEKLLDKPFGFKVSALPVKWVGTTAAPIRAIAIRED
jgi:kynurenine formamidase